MPGCRASRAARTRSLLGIVAAASALVAVQGTAARADAPDFVSAAGIEVTGSAQVGRRRFDVDMTSAQVTAADTVDGRITTRIVLPDGYAEDPSKRYPVLYLLHGAPGSSAQWVSAGARVEQITAGRPIIVVSVEGSRKSWYSNWRDPRPFGIQNWETFHMAQTVPWVDANLRTVASRRGRAIAGLSMGGFGAIKYAGLYNTTFQYAASFSGGLDSEGAAQSTAIIGTLTGLAGASYGPPATAGGSAIWGGFGVFGIGRDARWAYNNPLKNIRRYAGMDLGLYTGEGTNPVDVIEMGARDTTEAFHVALNRSGIRHHYDRYVAGRFPGCNGGHNMVCWSAALEDALPRMLAVLQTP